MTEHQRERSNISFISAGAGSGKTFRLTQKLQELLSSHAVTPAGVIATTFTKLAAGELKERVRSAMIEAGQLQVANQMEQSLIGTVNGVCGEILRRFAFEAGMPPDQQVLEESQGDRLFYEAMEQSLAGNILLIRQMNLACHRLQITDLSQQLNWRGEVKRIADAARANNQSPEDIRHLGAASADSLLAYFPKTTEQELDRLLLNAIEHAMAGIDTDNDSTKVTREYVALIRGIRAGLYKQRATWPEWITLTKKFPGAKSKPFAQPIADIANEYARHPMLQRDIRFFAEQAFAIAAASLRKYQLLKQQQGLIDFVDQEQQLYQLLDHPTVQNTLREELQLLMVDEFQDTSPIQLALFLKLSRLARQVIWVGDIKQSIYGFRGSDPELMRAVVQGVTEEGNIPEILEKSWRSTPELVAYVNNLFVPAFTDTLQSAQIALKPARASVTSEPAVELWRLAGGKKSERAQALACGIANLIASSRTVIDKQSQQPRAVTYSDIAILCRTHDNLNEVANALSEARLPIRFKRPGLLATPEGRLALACLRRLIDPLDTLASAEILTLTKCETPEAWIAGRMEQLNDPQHVSWEWMENEASGPLAALKAQRERLDFLAPVEVLRIALEAGNARECVYRWGPTEQRSQHRLNNLAELLSHAEEYMNQCSTQNQPATGTGLVLWLYQLAEAEEDTQANGGAENAIQLVTHHGAKGLEWPVVIAMDLTADLKPRLWGLRVLPSQNPISLENPLADRTLRYWPAFSGQQKVNVTLLDEIGTSAEGEAAMLQEVREIKRLLYVSLTRPRDALIITLGAIETGGEWIDTLQARWLLPHSETLMLPDGSTIPSRVQELTALTTAPMAPPYRPTWLSTAAMNALVVPLHVSPSTRATNQSARIGQIITLGDRLPISGEYDPAILGSALHAVIATTLSGQQATARVLADYGMEKTISTATASECARRFIDVIARNFNPVRVSTEYPVQFTRDNGQIVTGWIDVLIETTDGYVIVDHKASPRARSDWEEIALTYAGQLDLYAEGVLRATGRQVLSAWVHFGVTGGLAEVR